MSRISLSLVKIHFLQNLKKEKLLFSNKIICLMAEIGADSFSIFQFNIFVVKSSLTPPSLLVFLFKFSNGFKIESLHAFTVYVPCSPPRLANGTYLVYPNCCNLLYKVHYCEFGWALLYGVALDGSFLKSVRSLRNS